MRNSMQLLFAAVLCGAVLPAQAERPDLREPAFMTLQADAGKGELAIQVRGAHEDGLVAVLYGPVDEISIPLPSGNVLEVKPFGVLAWGAKTGDNWKTRIEYDPRFSAGLGFRLQAFSLSMGEDGEQKGDLLRSSHSILVYLPEGDDVADQRDADRTAAGEVDEDQDGKTDADKGQPGPVNQ